MPLSSPALRRISSDLERLTRLIEAAVIIRIAAASSASAEATLTRKMRAAFNAQGTDFLRRFRTLKPLFESATESDRWVGALYVGADGGYYLGWRGISEALRFDEWGPLWSETVLATAELIDTPIQAAAEAGWLAGANDQIINLKADFTFDLDNPRARAYLEEHGARQVARINEETRSQLRTLLVESNENGWSYQQTAREIRGKFDGFRGKSPLLHIRDRAELVAVTEVGNAYEAGAMSVASELESRGLRMEKHWFDAQDKRVHPGCMANSAAGWIPLQNRFPSGAMQALDHPGCRCHVQYRRVRDNRLPLNPELVAA